MNSFEKLLHTLVSTPSPSHEEAAAVDALIVWMDASGYDAAFRDAAGNAVGTKGNGPVEVVLLGHIDTFPGAPPVKVDGGKLYGRGSVDAKGPLATFAAAGANVEVPDGVRLVVIGAVEEEAATSAGAHFAATQYTPAACIIGEPSNWDRVTLGYKGRLLLEWAYEGAMAHSAGPQPTAAERAFGYWEDVQAFAHGFNTDRESLFARLDASIRDINTAYTEGGTHERAKMTVGFRLPPTLKPADLARQLQPENGATVRVFGTEDAYAADKSNAVARALRGAIREAGGKPRFVYKTGTSDMNVVGPRWNCPIVAYGPGDSALDHTPDEHIDLDEYLRAVDVLTRALQRLLTELKDTQ